MPTITALVIKSSPMVIPPLAKALSSHTLASSAAVGLDLSDALAGVVRIAALWKAGRVEME